MKNKEGGINGIIYGSRNIVNGKWYIGQTVNYKQRKQNHLACTRYNRDRCVFHAAIRKYGEDSFEWTVLESDIHTYDELNEREKYWIQEKNSLLPNGYNMNAGGNGTPNHRKNFVAWNKGKTGCYTEEALRRMSDGQKGRRVSEDQRKKISETLRGRHLSEEHKMHVSAGLKGKHHSMEWRKHISESHKGKKLSEETKEKISVIKRGKKLSEETRKRMSETRKGKTLSEAHRMRISEGHRGMVFTEEHKKKLSAAHKGKPLSEAHRMHISESNQGKSSKPVLMYSRAGDFVAEFPSVTVAADHIGVKHSQVSAVLNGKHKFTGGGYDRNAGYTFRYKNENPDR